MQTVILSNSGVVSSLASNELMTIVGAEIEKIQQDFTKAKSKNKTLAGNILHAYQLIDSVPDLELKIREMAILHQKEFVPVFYGGPKDLSNLKLMSTWVNFQQKGEFNPMHNHSGAYSFVLWYKIPYDMATEDAVSPGRNTYNNLAGKFQFIYPTITGDITSATVPVDRSWEGKMILFPASLQHTVHPFYSSDEYRISVSGNLFL